MNFQKPNIKWLILITSLILIFTAIIFFCFNENKVPGGNKVTNDNDSILFNISNQKVSVDYSSSGEDIEDLEYTFSEVVHSILKSLKV